MDRVVRCAAQLLLSRLHAQQAVWLWRAQQESSGHRRRQPHLPGRMLETGRGVAQVSHTACVHRSRVLLCLTGKATMLFVRSYAGYMYHGYFRYLASARHKTCATISLCKSPSGIAIIRDIDSASISSNTCIHSFKIRFILTSGIRINYLR